MVCHETYKDENNKWLNPDEVDTDDGKNFFLKNDKLKKVIVGSSESMSKSKKNTIDPENIIKEYGADAVRLFILSDSPPEKDVQWSDQGMSASYKFLQKLWVLHQKILDKSLKKNLKQADNENNIKFTKFTNQLVDKITKNLERFHYNGIIANLYEAYNFYIKIVDQDLNFRILINDYKKFLYLIMPIIPHFSSECLETIHNSDKIEWPITNKKLLEDDAVQIVIQINGKKKTTISSLKDIDEEELITNIKKSPDYEKILKGKKIVRNIFVKNRLINFIIK